MPSQQDLIDRFSFDALAGGDERLWQQARHWARSNATIRATIADVERGYRSINTATTDTTTDTTTEGSTDTSTSTSTHASTSRAADRLATRRAQIQAQRDRHGWTDDDGPVAA